MVASIGRDINFRATITDDTKRGAESAKRTIKDTVASAQKEAEVRRKNEIQSRIDLHKWEEDYAKRQNEEASKKPEGGHDGGAGHFGRIFSDASTTGLDTLSRGLVGGLGEKLGMGLQLGVLAVAGATLSHLTEGAASFSDEIMRGNKGAAEMVVAFGESVPLFGTLVSAGQNIREILTGEKVELERIKDFTVAITENNDRYFESSLKTLEVQRSQKEVLRQMKEQEAGVGLRGSDTERHALETKIKDAEAKEKLAIKQAEDAAATDPNAKGAQEKLAEFRAKNGERLAQLQNQLEHGRAMTASGRGGYQTEKSQEQIDLEEQEQALQAASTRQSGVRDKAKNDAIKSAKDQAAESKKITDAEMAEFNKRRGERLKIEKDTAAAEHERASTANAAAAERTIGNVYTSQKLEIAAAAESEKAQARIAAEERMNATTDAEEKAQIAAERDQKIKDIEENALQKRAELRKQWGIETDRIQHDTLESQADAEAQARANRLREDGQGYEADFALRQRAYERQKQDIDQRAEEAIKQNSDHEKEIRAKAEADKKKLDAQYKEGERQATEGRLAGQFGTAKEILEGRVDALRDEGRMGNIAAAAEAKRLEITERFAEKREKLNKMIRDPNVAQADKDLAKGQLAGLDAQEQRAKYMANFTGGATMPTLTIASRISGAAIKANEEGSPFIAISRYMKEQGKTLTDISESTAAMVRVFQQNPQVVALFNFKPGR